MISAAGRRLQQGATFATLGAELGISARAMRGRAHRLGVKSSEVLGRHRRRPLRTREELAAMAEKRREYARARRATGAIDNR